MLNRHKVNDNNLGSSFLGNPSPSDDNATYPVALVPPFAADPGSDGGDRNREMCMLVVTHLSAFQDDELDPEQRHIIAAHLNNCPDCAEVYESIQETDHLLQREWRDETPLPSSSERKQAIDNIMDALPPVPAQSAAFAPKRKHDKARWMRFAAGTTSIILVGLSYLVGYLHGRSSTSTVSIQGTSWMQGTGRYNALSTHPLLLPASLRETTSTAHTTRLSDTALQERTQ